MRGPDRLRDILHLLRAEIDELDRQLRPNLVLNSTRDANPARLSKSFQPGGDINRIAEETVALNNDVADVQSDPEPHLLTGRPIRNPLGYALLHRDSTLHSIHRTGEIGEHAVARRVEDPTAMRGN